VTAAVDRVATSLIWGQKKKNGQGHGEQEDKAADKETSQ
jgi:hypothetical protein